MLDKNFKLTDVSQKEGVLELETPYPDCWLVDLLEELVNRGIEPEEVQLAVSDVNDMHLYVIVDRRP